MKQSYFVFFLLLLISASCKHSAVIPFEAAGDAYRVTRSIQYQGVQVDLVIDKPVNNEVDVLLTYHGTVLYDSLILDAAHNVLDQFQKILEPKDLMLVSVAYPEEGLLFGDNIREAEAALLWVKEQAAKELGIRVRKVFLAGHSQGGYLVTRLNTLHATDGVIANGPGPLNLVYRCQLEEDGKIPSGVVCTALRNAYGTTTQNPDAYYQRSLLPFTKGFKGDLLLVQGLKDTPIQMYSWPMFKSAVKACSDCKKVEVLELAGMGHTALFQSQEAIAAFNAFLKARRS